MKTATIPRRQHERLVATLAEIADLLDDMVPAVGVPRQNVKEARELAVRALRADDVAESLRALALHQLENALANASERISD
jgi:uncharacterized protein (UPF0147 family)